MKPKVEINVSERELEYRSKYYQDFKAVRKEELRCMTCSRTLRNDIMPGKVFLHPLMGTLQCKKCNNFYGDGDFSMDEDNTDKYCRLCGDGGDLIMCKNVDANCPHGFCKKCITNNARKCLDDLESDGFKCFICNIKPFWKLRAISAAVSVEVSKKSRNHSKKPTVRAATSDSDDSRSQSDSSDSDFERKPADKSRFRVRVSRTTTEKQQHMRKTVNRLRKFCDDSGDDTPTYRPSFGSSIHPSRQKAETDHSDRKPIPNKSSENRKEETVQGSRAKRKENHRDVKTKPKPSQKKSIVVLSSSESDDEIAQEKGKTFKKSKNKLRSERKREKCNKDTEEDTSEEEHGRVSQAPKKIPQTKSTDRERYRKTKKESRTQRSSTVSEEDSDHKEKKQAGRQYKNSSQFKKRRSHSSDEETEREKGKTTVSKRKVLKTCVQKTEEESSSGKEFEKPQVSKSQKKRRTMRQLRRVDEDYTQSKKMKPSTERAHSRLTSSKKSFTSKQQGETMKAHVTELLNKIRALCTATAVAVDKISKLYLTTNFTQIDLVSEVAVKCKRLKTRMRKMLDDYETDFVESCETWCQDSGVKNILSDSKAFSASDFQLSPSKEVSVVNDGQKLDESNLVKLKPNTCSTPLQTVKVERSDSSASDEGMSSKKPTRKRRITAKSTSDGSSVGNLSIEDDAEGKNSNKHNKSNITASDSESEKTVSNTKRKSLKNNDSEGSNQTNDGDKATVMSDCDRDEIFSGDEARKSVEKNAIEKKDSSVSEQAIDISGENEVLPDAEKSSDKDIFSEMSRLDEEEIVAVKSQRERDMLRKVSKSMEVDSDEVMSPDNTENEAARSFKEKRNGDGPQESDKSEKGKVVSSESDTEEPRNKNLKKSTQITRKLDSESEETDDKKQALEDGSSDDDDDKRSKLEKRKTEKEHESAGSSDHEEMRTTRSKKVLAGTKQNLDRSSDNDSKGDSDKSPDDSLKPQLLNDKEGTAEDKLSDSDKSLFSEVSDSEEQAKKLPNSVSARLNDKKRTASESKKVSDSPQADRPESPVAAKENLNPDVDGSMSTMNLSHHKSDASDSEDDNLKKKLSDAESQVTEGRISNNDLSDSDLSEKDARGISKNRKQKGKSKRGSSHSGDSGEDAKKKLQISMESDGSDCENRKLKDKVLDSESKVEKLGKSKKGSSHFGDSDEDAKKKQLISSESDNSEAGDGEQKEKSSDSKTKITEQGKSKEGSSHSGDTDEDAKKKQRMSSESDNSESGDGEQKEKSSDSKTKVTKQGKSKRGSSHSGDSDEDAKKKQLISSESDSSKPGDGEKKRKSSDSKTEVTKQGKSKKGSSHSGDSDEDATAKLRMSSESGDSDPEDEQQKGKSTDSKTEVTKEKKSKKGSSHCGDSDEDTLKKRMKALESDDSEPENEKQKGKSSDSKTVVAEHEKSKKRSSSSGDSDEDAKKTLLMSSESDGTESEDGKQKGESSDPKTEVTKQDKSMKGSSQSGGSDEDAKKKLLMSSESDGSESEDEKQKGESSDSKTEVTKKDKSKKGSSQSGDSDDDTKKKLLLSSDSDGFEPRDRKQKGKTTNSNKKVMEQGKSKEGSSHSDDSNEDAKKKLLMSSESDGSKPEYGKRKGKFSDTNSKVAKLKKLNQESSPSSHSSDISDSDSETEQYSVKRRINTDSESSSTLRTRKRKIKLDKNPYYKADEKLRVDCEVVVQRLKQRVLSQFSHVIERSKRRQERRAFKRY